MQALVQGDNLMKINIQQSLQNVGENHRANIQRSLEHRLEVAKAKGDKNLIAQLEAEQNYYN